MTRTLQLSTAIVLALASAACSGKYKTFYNPATERGYPPSKEVTVLGDSPMQRGKLLDRGYIFLGHSEFVADLESKSQARRWGRKIGADVVLLSRLYSHDQTNVGAVPLAAGGAAPITVTHHLYLHLALYFRKPDLTIDQMIGTSSDEMLLPPEN